MLLPATVKFKQYDRFVVLSFLLIFLEGDLQNVHAVPNPEFPSSFPRNTFYLYVGNH